MRHKFPVLRVKKWLKSVHIYESYRKNKTGVPFFWTTLYVCIGTTLRWQSVLTHTAHWCHLRFDSLNNRIEDAEISGLGGSSFFGVLCR